MEKQNPSSRVLAALLVRDALGRRRQKPSQSVTLSERDVARVLMAISKMEDHLVFKSLLPRLLLTDCILHSSTPEGWPVPSRKLMEEIKKLL